MTDNSSSVYFINNALLSASIQSSFLLSAPMLRGVASGFPPNPPSTPRPCRPLHMWSHMPSVVDASYSAKIPRDKPTSGRKLLFDASSDGEASSKTCAESADDLMAFLPASMPQVVRADSASWLADALSSAQTSSSAVGHGERMSSFEVEDGSTLFTTSSSSSPPRTPSPSDRSSRQEVNRSPRFGDVRDPPAKFAATTSAEFSLSSSTAPLSGNNASQAPASVASSSAAASTSSISSPPPPPPSSPHAGLTHQWAKAFNVPRSSKRHDFMFEHGAYGIPKRHPLSSIRSGGSSALTRAKGKEVARGGERQVPGHDAVPTSKVQAAADMLAAAADFLAGPQMATSIKEHRPMRGEEALNMAFSGGSTADGHEVRNYTVYGSRKAAERRKESSVQTAGSNKVAIRDDEGRIIKDRLRSVQVGEDAYFLRPDSLGVADGVGGWASRPGADPALFSRLLMHFCAVELSRYDNLSATDLAADNGSLLKAWAAVDPVEVMHRAWERCVRAARREGILGSSTALLALLRGDELRIANVGDCVLMIIRKGEMLFRSTEQQHSFNFPVQLGMMGDTTETLKTRTEAANKARAAGEGEVRSEHLEDYDDVEDVPAGSKASSTVSSFEKATDGTTKRADAEESGVEWDEPRRDAGRWSVRVEAGDIIVVGSDGLMDNLFDEDIIEEVLRFVPVAGDTHGEGGEEFLSVDSSTFSPQLVSEALCSRAKAVSEDSRAISSPFQQRAMEEGLHYVGGKHDDISVLVCLVGEREGIDASTGNNPDSSTTTTTGKCLIS